MIESTFTSWDYEQQAINALAVAESAGLTERGNALHKASIYATLSLMAATREARAVPSTI